MIKKKIYACLVGVILCTISINSSFANTEATTVDTNNHYFDFAPLVLHQENLDLNLSIKVLYSLIKNINFLHYQTAKEMVIAIPGTNQELSFSWGFGGSGNIFTPLPTVTSKLRQNTTTLGHEDDIQSSFIAGLSKTILQNELTKAGQKILPLQWLTTTTLNPYVLFGIKFILLIKDTLNKDLDLQQVYPEIIRLLIRLSLTETVEPNAMQHVSISAALPINIKMWANEVSPGILNFVDTMWEQLHGHITLSEATPPQVVSCFIFKNEQLAQKTYKEFKFYAGDNFLNDVTLFIKQQGGQAISFNDFQKIQAPTVWQTKPHISRLLQRLVGTLSWIGEPSQHQNIPENVRSELVTQKHSSFISLITVSPTEFWLVQATENLDFSATYKTIALCFAQAFHDYAELKKDFLVGNKEESLAYNKKRELLEQENLALQTFLKSEDGKQAYNRLLEKFKLLQKQPNQQTTAQDYLKQKEQIQADLANLQKQQTTLQADLTSWQVLRKYTPTNNYSKFDFKINEIKGQLETTQKLIAQKTKELAAFAQEQESSLPIIQNEQDQKNLSRLLALLNEQEKNGQTPSPELLQAIDFLKQKIKPIAPKTPSKVNIDNRLAKRGQFIEFLENEQKTIKKQLAEQLNKIQAIKESETRMVEQLLFNPLKFGYEIYLKQLATEASRIMTTHEKALTLKTYKNVSSKINFSSLTQQDQEMVRKLEDEVGYLFTAIPDENFVDNILGKNSDFKEFMSDLNDNQTPFSSIKKHLFENMATIIGRSTHIQNNTAMYRYLIQQFLPDLLPLFNKALDVKPQPTKEPMTNNATQNLNQNTVSPAKDLTIAADLPSIQTPLINQSEAAPTIAVAAA